MSFVDYFVKYGYTECEGVTNLDRNEGIMEENKSEEMSELAEPILPSRLRYLRENYIDPDSGKIGLSTSELADILSISESSVKKYESESENNSALPGLDVIDKMCALYQTELYFSHKKRHPVLVRREQLRKNQASPKQ